MSRTVSSQVRIQPASGFWSELRSSLSTSLGAVVLGAVGAVRVQLAQLLADRGELLAQQELALLALDALADVLADLLGDLLLGEVLLRPREERLQPRRHVGLGEQPGLLLGVEVGRPAGEVGQRARVRRLLDVVDHLPRTALLQDRHDERLVLLGQLEHAAGGRGVVDRLGLDPQGGAGTGHARPDAGADIPADHGGLLPAGEPAHLLEDRDGAHRGVAAVEAGHHQDTTVDAARGIDRCLDLRLVQPQRDHHAGQHDRVGQRKHRQLQRLCHAGSNAYTVAGVPAFNHVR
jgi:hypothetical protein